jgi:hypothetical protein
VRGLPLDTLTVSDKRRTVDIHRRADAYFLPSERITESPAELTVADSGIGVKLKSVRAFDKSFIILPTDDLSLFDKRLAPRLLVKSKAADIFIAFERAGENIRFFAHSLSMKKGVLPASAYLLHALFGVRNISTDTLSFRFEYLDGKSYLVCSI